jgi:hypothetical protein
MMPSDHKASPARPWEALAGSYQLRPGEPPGVVGQRPVLGAGRLGQLLRGQRGTQVGLTLGSVFTLCAHAHQRTCALALAAAQDGPAPRDGDGAAATLCIETARDHLRSIALDWPQRLPDPTPAASIKAWLQACPLPLATARASSDEALAREGLVQLRTWLENRILQQPVSAWLAQHRDPDALAFWCHTHAQQLLPARCLAAWQPLAQGLTPPLRSLDLLDHDPEKQSAQLRALAQQMADEPDFVQRPSWQGLCAETGPWTRLRHRATGKAARHSAWTRLSARWLDLVELTQASTRGDDAPPLLASGALRLGRGQALAWCEMARGLLLHWVQLDATGAVQDYRVLAPTEWNFHPQSVLARAVASLPAGEAHTAQMLAAAFDPCVACTVQSPAGA